MREALIAFIPYNLAFPLRSVLWIKLLKAVHIPPHLTFSFVPLALHFSLYISLSDISYAYLKCLWLIIYSSYTLTQNLTSWTQVPLFYSLMSSSVWILRRQRHPTPVLLPGKSHGWRSLEGCSLLGRWGLDTTELLHFHFSLSCIGEGNGNPLQCSCLENPRDGEAWRAAVYGVAQSRTRLKRLSSCSSISVWIKPII